MLSHKANRSMAQALGDLKKAGYRKRSVKEEMRENVIAMLRKGESPFPDIVGYEETVLPGIVNALLSKHDFILLGLRGQAKTRILRSLTRFLDEYIPILAGTELNDDPFDPVSARGRRIVSESGDRAEISWLHRTERYREKLATPDVTIADLIGDVDPIKAATQRLTYSDEEVVHYGIIPRTNRGIFAINEIPDLPSRIQVGLLNILEEEDIQIRGFGSWKVRQANARPNARNPRTGERVYVPARRKVTFRPGKVLKKELAKSSRNRNPSGLHTCGDLPAGERPSQ